MLWSPSGPTVTVDANPKQFVPSASGNLGGVARLFNVGATAVTFTLGTSGLASNTDAIPVGAGQDMIIAYGPTVTHVFASNATDLRITPGIGRP